MKIEMQPIGYIKSEYKNRSDLPRQSFLNNESVGQIVVEDRYIEGISGLEEDDYIEIIFFFDKSKEYSLITKSGKSEKVSGVFATRSPNRPNGIGISICKIKEVKGNEIYFYGVDMLDNTPVLDIKPYIKGLKIK